MIAHARCECGETRCPHQEETARSVIDAARAWLLKLRFVRVEHGSLICVVCHAPMSIRVEKTALAE